MDYVIDVNSIIYVATILVTYIFGLLVKKFDLVKSEHIPLQNICIGILAGFFVWACGLNNNIIYSIIYCVLSSLSAGGLYDVVNSK